MQGISKMLTWTEIKCILGWHDLHVQGRLRNKCSKCKSVWYTDYFLSCEMGGVERFEVIDRHGNVLPEMKRWNTVHEYDREPVN